MIRRLSLLAGLTLLVGLHLMIPAHAQLVPSDAQPAMVCFYDCQLDRTGNVWTHTTGLVLSNPFAEFPAQATIQFYDGQENLQGCAITDLSENDVDTINVCETLDGIVGTPPVSGLIYTVFEYTDDTPGAGYEGLTPAPGWVKNFLGSFRRASSISTRSSLNAPTVVEPHNGTVNSIGKTQCQLVWFQNDVPSCPEPAPLVYIEATEDPAP